MPKNDMSAFKKRTSSPSILTQSEATTAEKKPIGKPKKPENEKLSKRVQIMLSPAEFAKLETERGAIPLSAFLRNKLQENEVI